MLIFTGHNFAALAMWTNTGSHVVDASIEKYSFISCEDLVYMYIA